MARLDKTSRRMNNRRMSKARTLKTVSAIIQAFGPPGCKRTAAKKALAEWADVGISAVCNWETVNHIPEGWHYRMHLELERRGFKVDPAAFGVSAPSVSERLRRVA